MSKLNQDLSVKIEELEKTIENERDSNYQKFNDQKNLTITKVEQVEKILKESQAQEIEKLQKFVQKAT